MSGDGAVGRGSLDPTDVAFVDVVSDLLRRGHSVRFRAKGRSMHPAIREGEAITVAPVQPAEIRRGDVILCDTGRGVIAHRVARVVRDAAGTPRFFTQGDASLSPDEPAEASAVMGRIVAVERNGRTLDPAAWSVRMLACARAAARRSLRCLRPRPRRP
jgi:hypothetical protein